MGTIQIPNKLFEYIDLLKEKGVPKSEYKKLVNRFLDSRARALSVPFHGTFELTPFCNLNCKMCYVHLDDKKYSQDCLLPVDVWKNLMCQARKEGMIKAALTGGECLTYPNFEEIYIYLCNMGVRTAVLSNGVLLDQNRIKLFIKYRPSLIQISLYGASNDEYEAVTGNRVFDSVYKNLIMLKEASLPVMVSITPNQYMFSDAKDLFEIVEALAIPYSINARLIQPRSNTGRGRIDVSDDRYIEIYKMYSKIKNIPLCQVDQDTIPDENKANNGPERRGIICGAGRSTFAVLHDGRMTPCVCLDQVYTNPLVEGFKNSWVSLNAMVNTFLMPSECQECVYHKECLLCPALHKNAPVGHCDPLICERTKKLVKSGLLPVPKR